MITVIGFVLLFLGVFFIAAGIKNKNDTVLITVAVVVTLIGAFLVGS